LVLDQRILDCKFVQVQLSGDLVEHRLFRRAQIDPDHEAFVLQQIGDVGKGEVAAVEHVLAIRTCLDRHGHQSTSLPLAQVTPRG
jgi:hypothetical protein